MTTVTAFHTVFLHLLSIAGDVVAPKVLRQWPFLAPVALVGSYRTAGVVACLTESCAWCLSPDPGMCNRMADEHGASPTALAVSPAPAPFTPRPPLVSGSLRRAWRPRGSEGRSKATFARPGMLRGPDLAVSSFSTTSQLPPGGRQWPIQSHGVAHMRLG